MVLIIPITALVLQSADLHSGTRRVFNLTISPHNLSARQSSRVEFECSVCSEHLPMFTWNFTRRGASDLQPQTIARGNIVSSTNFFVNSEPRRQVLVITNVQLRHEGVYTCIASSNISQIQAEAILNVLSESTNSVIHRCNYNIIFLCLYACILVPLTGLVIHGTSGTPTGQDTVTIECRVTANPPANIVWMKLASGRIEILDPATPRMSVTSQLTRTASGLVSSSTLTILEVEAADNGDYICEASNTDPLSPPQSASFTLCVVGKVH